MQESKITNGDGSTCITGRSVARLGDIESIGDLREDGVEIGVDTP